MTTRQPAAATVYRDSWHRPYTLAAGERVYAPGSVAIHDRAYAALCAFNDDTTTADSVRRRQNQTIGCPCCDAELPDSIRELHMHAEQCAALRRPIAAALAAGIPADRYRMELAAAAADRAAYADTSRPVRCSRCGSRMPADRSCDCFDNGCQ